MQTQSDQTKGKKKKDWHGEIAKNRGVKWRKNLVKGRRESQLKPSIIQLVRIKLGLDQKSIAEKMDLSPSTIGAIERGRQPVKLDSARKIAKILRQPVDKLFKVARPSLNSKRKKYVAILREQSV